MAQVTGTAPAQTAVTPPDGGPERVAVTGVAKSFGATRALTDASLEIRPGEVHTVMGENGSGKSTLVKVLSGVHQPDRGTLAVDGAPVAWLSAPAQAHRIGIATVFQEVLTVPGRTVLENIWLGASRSGVDGAERRAKAASILGELIGRDVDVDASVDTLSLSERQACCIVRAMVREPSLLVLDESTAALDVATRDRLFGLVRQRTPQGASVLFISHRMDEVFEISDVVTVFRNGATVASRIPISDTSATLLVGLMSDVGERPSLRAKRSVGELLLRATQVQLAPGCEPLDLDVRAGELIGLAGLEGQGQDLFLKALRGAPPAGGSVRRAAGSASVLIDRPAVARRHGITYVPRERRREGLFEQLSIRENFGLARMGDDRVGPLISSRRTDARLNRFGERLRIKMAKPSDPIASLSGGNQQKVLVARSLADDPTVLLLNDPTRGIDPKAKHDLYEVLLDLCERGLAVVMLSSDVDELLDLADRVIVFRANRISAELVGDQITRTNIVAAYFGSEEQSVAAVLEDEGTSE